MSTMHPRDQGEGIETDDDDQSTNADPRGTRVQSGDEDTEQNLASDPVIINKDR